MARTDSASVIEVLGFDPGGLDSYIAVAAALIADLADKFEACGVDEERLTLLETWLSAHVASLASPAGGGAVTAETELSVSRSYSDKLVGDGLKLTSYGRMVDALDTCDVLSGKLGTRPIFEVLT